MTKFYCGKVKCIVPKYGTYDIEIKCCNIPSFIKCSDDIIGFATCCVKTGDFTFTWLIAPANDTDNCVANWLTYQDKYFNEIYDVVKDEITKRWKNDVFLYHDLMLFSDKNSI